MNTSTDSGDASKDGVRIDTTRAAMQQALDLIEGSGCKADLMAAADALRAALAEQPQPVAWTVKDEGLYWTVVALYTIPPAPVHQPVHQPVHGWTDADADAARLALELECLLTDKDVPLSAASRWWDSAHEALRLHRERLAAAPEAPTPPAPQRLTIERLRDALVASRIIDPGAVEDPDDYDDGVTLHRIEALFRRIA